MSKPSTKCTYCGHSKVVARMDTGALRTLGKRDWVHLCQRCVKMVNATRACGCGAA